MWLALPRSWWTCKSVHSGLFVRGRGAAPLRFTETCDKVPCMWQGTACRFNKRVTTNYKFVKHIARCWSNSLSNKVCFLHCRTFARRHNEDCTVTRLPDTQASLKVATKSCKYPTTVNHCVLESRFSKTLALSNARIWRYGIGWEEIHCQNLRLMILKPMKLSESRRVVKQSPQVLLGIIPDHDSVLELYELRQQGLQKLSTEQLLDAGRSRQWNFLTNKAAYPGKCILKFMKVRVQPTPSTTRQLVPCVNILQ